jgi:hypothetical protein
MAIHVSYAGVVVIAAVLGTLPVAGCSGDRGSTASPPSPSPAPSTSVTTIAPADRDGDGIPDSSDSYPDDPTNVRLTWNVIQNPM